MSDDTLLVDRLDKIALITINRPVVHNALNAMTLTALADTISEFGDAGEIRAVVVTGAGDRAFSAGADLDELAGLVASDAHRVLSEGQRCMARIEASRVPVIAAVNGLALGGGFELVLACTFAVLSTKASLALPESGLGLMPGYGGTQRLPRAIGRPVAAHLMLTGSRLSAQRAYELGLTPFEPVDPAELLTEALQLARDIASRGPRAQSSILQAMPDADGGGLVLETALAAIVTSSDEAAEGIAAFRDRRAPEFHSVQRHATVNT